MWVALVGLCAGDGHSLWGMFAGVSHICCGSKPLTSSPTFNPELCWSFKVFMFAAVLALVFCSDICNGQFMDFVLHLGFNSALGFKESAIFEPLRFYIWHWKLACHGASLAFFQSNILKMPFPSGLCLCDRIATRVSTTCRCGNNFISQGFLYLFSNLPITVSLALAICGPQTNL